MSTLTVEVSLSINATGAPELSSVTSVSPSADGAASIDQTTSPPTLTVDDYEHDTVVVNLNAPAGETIDQSTTSSTITPTSAPISYSWSAPATP